jgi:signal transduction histidine kinase/DNA-binding response OmpR family regulator
MRTEGLLKQSQSLAQELQLTNVELQEKAALLAHQNAEVERKNAEVESARQELETKAKQLALTSKYKSEFLANMSHELRTPLNSLLILSDQLSRNPEGNLSIKQIEFVKTIHSSGNDLLMLINDILDLSKIESGTVVVDIGELRFTELHSYVERTFRHVAENKGVGFDIRIEPGLARSMSTDAKRLQQVIKNLLSNAFKFTHHGRVSLAVGLARGGWNPENDELNRAPAVVAFAVEDTGIGIPPDKQQIIFEAFQQADGSTSRKYGGTGLGLAISREISRLLGGEIRLTSATGKGSTFTLYLPLVYAQPKGPRKPAELPLPPPVPRSEVLAPEPAAPALVNEVGDDRQAVQPGDRTLLIVENDLAFAKLILEAARQKGFKGLVTSLGAAALALARDFTPDAVTLDLRLPDIDGRRVLERLKNDVATRHIPVCVVTTEDVAEQVWELGATWLVNKPLQSLDVLDQALETVKEFVNRPSRDLMLVSADPDRREQLLRTVDGGPDVRVTVAVAGREALRLLRERPMDALVLDPDLPDMTVEVLAEALAAEAGRLPVVVWSEADPDGDAGLKRLASSFTVLRAASPERLLDQVTFALHRPVASLSPDRRQILEKLYSSSTSLAGKTVLVVDDDIRNIFALTSVLERQGMHVLAAESGRQAIDVLQREAHLDIVLMDIMMPEMDGIETMQAIRQVPKLKSLPIIAVTAKAMKGDREKCLEAGAWDYLSKPVDIEQLLAVLRGWLHR